MRAKSVAQTDTSIRAFLKANVIAARVVTKKREYHEKLRILRRRTDLRGLHT
jgi:hypothetical protein